MAKTTTTLTCPPARVIPPVTVERWNWCDFYAGTKEALIAEGVLTDGQFPGDPGQKATSCSFEKDGAPFLRVGNRKAPVSIRRYTKRLFHVYILVDEAEKERRRAAKDARAEARKKAEEAEAEVKSETERLAELPATGEAWANQAAKCFWAVWNVYYSQYMDAEPDEAGFRFTPSDRAILEGLAQGLYDQIRWADTRFDVKRRMQGVNEARAKAAKADAPLQQLLSTVTKAKTGVRHEV